jgi:hypothetical protein
MSAPIVPNSELKFALKGAVGSPELLHQLLGVIGVQGGFSINTNLTVNTVDGNITVIQDPNGTGYATYRIELSNEYNKFIQSSANILNFNISGFSPRNPTVTEPYQALCTGFGLDGSSGNWYFTVTIANWSGVAQNTLTLPSSLFVVGFSVVLATII